MAEVKKSPGKRITFQQVADRLREENPRWYRTPWWLSRQRPGEEMEPEELLKAITEMGGVPTDRGDVKRAVNKVVRGLAEAAAPQESVRSPEHMLFDETTPLPMGPPTELEQLGPRTTPTRPEFDQQSMQGPPVGPEVMGRADAIQANPLMDPIAMLSGMVGFGQSAGAIGAPMLAGEVTENLTGSPAAGMVASALTPTGAGRKMVDPSQEIVKDLTKQRDRLMKALAKTTASGPKEKILAQVDRLDEAIQAVRNMGGGLPGMGIAPMNRDMPVPAGKSPTDLRHITAIPQPLPRGTFADSDAVARELMKPRGQRDLTDLIGPQRRK